MLERGNRAGSSEELVQERKAVRIQKKKLLHITLATIWCNVPSVSLIFSLKRYCENGENQGYSVESFVNFAFHMTMLAW